MHTREETDELNIAEISGIVSKIIELKDELSEIDLSDYRKLAVLGDFISDLENAIFDFQRKFKK